MSHYKLARYRRHFVLSVTQKIVSFTSESVRNGILGRLNPSTMVSTRYHDRSIQIIGTHHGARNI